MLKAATLCALLGATAAAGAQTPRLCQVTDNIEGLGDKPVVFVYEQHGKQHRDTVRAAGGRFSHSVPPTNDGTCYLKIVPGRVTTFWAAAGEITVRGTPENDVTAQSEQEIGWLFERRRTAHPDSALALRKLAQRPTLAFVKTHPRARTSAELLYWQTMYDDQPVAEYAQLLRGAGRAGQRAGPQSGPVPGGAAQPARGGPPGPGLHHPRHTASVAVPLSRVKRRLVLLDFWGHWCGPCIQSIPHLKQVQAQYARQLAVVGIGMEAADDKHQWQQAIRKHQANWTQLSELKGKDGVIAQYNITAFPT